MSKDGRFFLKLSVEEIIVKSRIVAEKVY